jgi:hypothetical protein
MSTFDNNDALQASCHCGRIQVTLPSRPTELNECHCTVCYKYGAMWSYFDPDDVIVTITDGATLEAYVRSDPESDGDIAFNRCSHCGCMMTWRGAGKREDLKKMGINCRMMPEEDTEGIPRRISMSARSKK